MTAKRWRGYCLFLLTPLREGRPIAGMKKTAAVKFLLTPLREGRPQQPFFSYHRYNFYSRPCGRGDHAGNSISEYTGTISTHAPAGGATQDFDQAGRRKVISTHAPAGGATAVFQLNAGQIGISTHAPAGGATVDVRRRHQRFCNFYSRPCGRGDEASFRSSQYRRSHFYSRPCGRGDGRAAGEEAVDFRISTHAPAGGATGRPTLPLIRA